MNRVFSPGRMVSGLTSGSLAWPHLQRLAERWLRRWGFALIGLAVGLSGMWLARPELGEAHASAVQAVASLTQQLAGIPSGAAAQTPAKPLAANNQSAANAQRLLSGLPAGSQPEHVWTIWQQALVAHGLRLQSLQPMPPTASEGRSGVLISHVAAWRVLGRFDDWARVWAACAESGPVCAIERIQIAATDQPSEVQIDAVMRVWMRPLEKRAANASDQVAVQPTGEDVQVDWLADARADVWQSRRSRVALFAPVHGAASVAAVANTGLAGGDTPSTNAKGGSNASAAVGNLSVLPDDPYPWPYARLRLAGLWQQGGERQAVLSAGAHSVRVSTGQRVTLEGHQVVAINDAGVHLRLGMGPVLLLSWANPLQVAPAPRPSAGQLTGSSTPASTTGSEEK